MSNAFSGLRPPLYAGLLLLSLATVAAARAGSGLVLPLALLAAAFGAGSAALLWWRHGERDVAAWLGDLHPRLGLLTHVPTTARALLVRLGVYALVVALAAFPIYGDARFMATDAQDLETLRFVASALLLVLLTLLPAELLAVPVVARWGTTPASHVLLGWLSVSALLGLLAGLPAAAWLLARLPEMIGSWPSLVLTWVPIVTVGLMSFGLWLRHIPVARWQARLTAQTQRAVEAEQGRKLAEAQLAMLQAQIEPHFLYNTLASVQYLVGKDAASANFLLTQLIRYLRHAMPKLRAPLSTLAQEFELADAYLQIARLRMGGRLSVSLELDAALHDEAFPPLVLQTLVENALLHGVEPKLGPVHIAVGARRDGERLELTVRDDGVGLGRSPHAGSGTGLANLRARLAGLYGAPAQLTIERQADGGTVALVRLPIGATTKATT